jgi:hypothetical protein
MEYMNDGGLIVDARTGHSLPIFQHVMAYEPERYVLEFGKLQAGAMPLFHFRINPQSISLGYSIVL